MSNQAIDLTGQRFGRLIVVEYKGKNESRVRFWLCKCDCGNERIVRYPNLTSGNTKSCGCLNRDMASKRSKQSVIHGKCDTRIYSIWSGMKSRCNYKNSDSFTNYGERGITICKEWADDFQAFHDWAITNGYSDDLSIDRINNDGNYEPSNCRWATVIEQHNNRGDNVFITYDGQTLTIAETARKYNIKYNILLRRINRGWTVERTIEQPIKGGK